MENRKCNAEAKTEGKCPEESCSVPDPVTVEDGRPAPLCPDGSQRGHKATAEAHRPKDSTRKAAGGAFPVKGVLP